MESISGKLLAAREAKGVTTEQAARETHISKRYIEALESESFDDFPAEAYFLGFLRTYSGYLGLDPESVVALYRNHQLQEQPAPIDELLNKKPRRPFPLKPVAAALLVVLLVGGGVALFVTGALRLPSFGSAEAEDLRQEPVVRITDRFVEQRFVEGNRVAVPLDDGEAVFEFVSIGERVAVGSEAGVVELFEGDERLLDITGGGSPDVRVSIRRVYSDEMPPAAVARIDRVLQPTTTLDETETVLSDEDRFDIAIGQTTEPSRERASRVIARLDNDGVFNINAEFLGLTLFRYRLDDEAYQEEVFSDGDTLSIPVSDLARVWASNAGNVRMNVAAAELDLGSQGEVVSVVLRRAESGGEPVVELLPLY